MPLRGDCSRRNLHVHFKNTETKACTYNSDFYSDSSKWKKCVNLYFIRNRKRNDPNLWVVCRKTELKEKIKNS